MYAPTSSTKPKLPLRYFVYARKSSTNEDRQVASIESQIEVMGDVAHDNQLKVVDTMSESCSGFKVGRPVFNRMVERIENGEADGIVVWKLSRLSRNPDDAGRIMGMLQRGEIKHIRTVDRNWYPEDNVMMMYVEFGLTNQFSRDLSADTHRGLLKKAERGWYPGASLPLGYRHAQYKRLGEDEILPNDVFDLVSKGLKLVASHQMIPAEARVYMESLGLHGKRVDTLPSTTWYDLLVNPMYAGRFEYPASSGTFYDSKAKKAIEPEEFEEIQYVLGLKNKPRPKTHYFPYTGLMSCGECGCSITAEKKTKHQENGNTHSYTYYRCTKKKGPCRQHYLLSTELERQFGELLDAVQIPEGFHDWAIGEIKKDQEKSVGDRQTSLQQAQTGYNEVLKQMDTLVGKYLDDKVPEDYYQRRLAELEHDKETRKRLLDSIDTRVDERLQELDQDLSFAATAAERFAHGDERTRREIVSYLGSNLVLTDGVLDIQLKKPLFMLKSVACDVRAIARRFEPLEKTDNMVHFKDYLSNNPVMGE